MMNRAVPTTDYKLAPVKYNGLLEFEISTAFKPKHFKFDDSNDIIAT